MTEHRAITIAAYRDPAGRPTCAVDFRTGLVCRLLQTARMGMDDVCALQTGRRPCLDRYDGGTGYLMPAKVCPVWADVDMPTEGAAAFEAQRDELLACLRDCVEYVDEEELRHVAAYGEHHHAARLARVREDAKKARAAIARAEGGAA